MTSRLLFDSYAVSSAVSSPRFAIKYSCCSSWGGSSKTLWTYWTDLDCPFLDVLIFVWWVLTARWNNECCRKENEKNTLCIQCKNKPTAGKKLPLLSLNGRGPQKISPSILISILHHLDIHLMLSALDVPIYHLPNRSTWIRYRTYNDTC